MVNDGPEQNFIISQRLWNAENRKVWHSWVLDLEISISEHPSKRVVTQITFQKWFYCLWKICVTTLLDGCSEMGISWCSTQKCETFKFKLFSETYKFKNLSWKHFLKIVLKRNCSESLISVTARGTVNFRELTPKHLQLHLQHSTNDLLLNISCKISSVRPSIC